MSSSSSCIQAGNEQVEKQLSEWKSAWSAGDSLRYSKLTCWCYDSVSLISLRPCTRFSQSFARHEKRLDRWIVRFRCTNMCSTCVRRFSPTMHAGPAVSSSYNDVEWRRSSGLRDIDVRLTRTAASRPMDETLFSGTNRPFSATSVAIYVPAQQPYHSVVPSTPYVANRRQPSSQLRLRPHA